MGVAHRGGRGLTNAPHMSTEINDGIGLDNCNKHGDFLMMYKALALDSKPMLYLYVAKYLSFTSLRCAPKRKQAKLRASLRHSGHIAVRSNAAVYTS